MIGYTTPLYILPFDHRSSFVKDLFHLSEESLTLDQAQEVKTAKKIIYEGFLKATETSVPKDGAAILVDEQFGSEILHDARSKGYITMLTTEKSGQKEFKFQYDMEFAAHIEMFKPTFTKALLRYNPTGDTDLNKRQLETLKELSDYCHNNNYKFLVEPLIPPTEEQLADMGKDIFDTNLRPQLTLQMMEDFHDAGVEPDVWKIEGLHNKEEYERAVKVAHAGGRESGIVILGRAATVDVVDGWIRAGSNVPGVLGFAVGRTVFWEPLVKYYDHSYSREEAITKIAENYIHFYNVFTNKYL